MPDPLSTTVLIPFLFVFAIVFGVLEVAGVFKNRAVMAIIAFVIAFFAVTDTSFLNFLNTFLPVLIWVFVGLFILVAILRLLKKEASEDRAMTTVVGAVAMLIFITIGFLYVPEVPVVGKQNFLILVGMFFLIFIFYNAAKAKPEPQAKANT